jgi:hypothetical protein
LFFFEKKNQKTFVIWCTWPGWRGAGEHLGGSPFGGLSVIPVTPLGLGKPEQDCMTDEPDNLVPV